MQSSIPFVSIPQVACSGDWVISNIRMSFSKSNVSIEVIRGLSSIPISSVVVMFGGLFGKVLLILVSSKALGFEYVLDVERRLSCRESLFEDVHT